ncbi:MAG: fused MFS/spermidine synthase [Kiritimatiellia bacterium]
MKTGAFYIAAFLSAFLLFSIQPVSSKAILPLFGGSYLVWGAAMVFYQTILLAGYLYAHVVQRRLGVFNYGKLHCFLVILPLLMMPFGFESWNPASADVPLTASVFALLLVSVGIPCMALSTTSLVLQRWLSHSDLERKTNPYVLYASSNLGSMLGLVTYPFVVEPMFSLSEQADLWWTAYALLVPLHFLCFPWKTARLAKRSAPTPAQLVPGPGAGRILRWLGLSAAPCAAFVAVTNVLTLDLASVPLLWVLPLGVFLGAFAVAFKHKRWRPPWLKKLFPWSLLLGMTLYLTSQLRLMVPLHLTLPLYLLILLVLCLNTANTLSDSRPAGEGHLTTYYLAIAFGGVAGSFTVTWIVPVVSQALVEYPLSLALAAGFLASAEGNGSGKAPRTRTTVLCVAGAAAGLLAVPFLWVRFAPEALPANLLLISAALPVAFSVLGVLHSFSRLAIVLAAITVFSNWTEVLSAGGNQIMLKRNYYGIYRVYEKNGLRYLQHGTTQHGRQYVRCPGSATPLAYYHPRTPAAQIMKSDPFDFEKIGMIGLGTGALAAYVSKGQTLTIYELDPDNIPIAEKYFGYLDRGRKNGAEIRFVVGDGRRRLRERPDGSLDVLVVDAFNSGSIPVHLITVDAFREYFRKLDSGGVLLLHVSNKALSLKPVVFSNALACGLRAAGKTTFADPPDADYTSWMAVTRDAEIIRTLVERYHWNAAPPAHLPGPWTDNYSNLMGALLRGGVRDSR